MQVHADHQPLAYTIAGAARALSLSERSIYNMMKDGTLRRVKRGSRTLIPAADVRAVVSGEA
jgi:excisionase family DNA binding protein